MVGMTLVVVGDGGGGVVLVRAFCVCEMEQHGGEGILVAFGGLVVAIFDREKGWRMGLGW